MIGCRPLSDDEISRVARTLKSTRYPKRNSALFWLGVKSGFRISELLSLRLKDIYQAGVVIDRVTVARRYMKQKLEGRTVLIHPRAKSALLELIRELQKTGHATDDAYLFRSRKGRNRPIGKGQAWTIFKTVFARAGCTGKLGTHSMRKTFADRIYKRLGRDLIRTKIALGHRSINVTERYLSFEQKEVDEAILKA